jgi:hypothetical protein
MDCWLDILVWFLGGARYCSLVHSVQTGSGAHPPGVKRMGREDDHSPPSRSEVKNGGAILPLPHSYSWCSAYLIKTTLSLPSKTGTLNDSKHSSEVNLLFNCGLTSLKLCNTKNFTSCSSSFYSFIVIISKQQHEWGYFKEEMTFRFISIRLYRLQISLTILGVNKLLNEYWISTMCISMLTKREERK